MNKINIVYSCWCNPNKNYKNIIFGQLDDIINVGILDISKLYIECCCKNTKIANEMKILFAEKLQKYVYEVHYYEKNKYEYYGIKKMYDLAILEPEKYYIYFHSKCMSYNSNPDERHIYESTLTKGTFFDYENTVEIFNKNSIIVKAGLFPASQHKNEFCWLNFYWVKGTYLVTCEPPIVTDDKYYYQLWLESGNSSLGFVYNLYENNYKKYTLLEVGDILNRLNGSFSKKE